VAKLVDVTGTHWDALAVSEAWANTAEEKVDESWTV
jgi:hypothetical protein